ncbi:cysteine-rich receptor-like protein kinase 10 [Lolium perenne]|uniref:cysteine-rich receptor-like protein kinase 10 n=1 Tax=Lolium perenne TaxID=4522 RepID=UPI003A9A61F5
MAVVILPLFLLLLPFAAAQGPWQYCGTGGTYTSNSIYQANLKLLSSTLPKKAASNTTLFATDTIGNLPDIIFALALCRGDSNASACEGCLATAFQDGEQLCPYSRDASIYYHSCMLRFSNTNFLPTMVDQSWKTVESSHKFNTSIDSNSTRQLLFTLINSTAQSAANSSRRFMTSRLDVRSFPAVYCLMQCTPDLSASDCAFCFGSISKLMFWYINGPQGDPIMGTRCNMRYEMYQFFRGDPMMRITAAVAPPVGGRTVEQNSMYNSHLSRHFIIWN